MKKTVTLLLASALFLFTLTGCMKASENNTDPFATQTSESTATTASSPNTDSTLEQASPVSDFRYEITNENEVTILSYGGNDTEVIIPSHIEDNPVTEIGLAAFYLNSQIVSVVIPDSVKFIGHDAFGKCTSLQTVVLSANLTAIDVLAFEYCESLSNIKLPESLTSIGYRAFANCTSLKHISIPGNCLNENSGECFADSGLESVQLKEGVSIIPASAFLRTKIKEIILPSTVKNIEDGALATGCLKSVQLNEGLEIIAMTAFSSNPLTEIVIPKTVISCSEYSFTDCESLIAIKFEGDAPKDFLCESDLLNEIFAQSPINFTIFYHQEAQGFTSPTWHGYETDIW